MGKASKTTIRSVAAFAAVLVVASTVAAAAGLLLIWNQSSSVQLVDRGSVQSNIPEELVLVRGSNNSYEITVQNNNPTTTTFTLEFSVIGGSGVQISSNVSLSQTAAPFANAYWSLTVTVSDNATVLDQLTWAVWQTT